MNTSDNEQFFNLKSLINNYDVVIFDMDDTLISTKNVNYLLYKNFLKKFTIELKKRMVKHFQWKENRGVVITIFKTNKKEKFI